MLEAHDTYKSTMLTTCNKLTHVLKDEVNVFITVSTDNVEKLDHIVMITKLLQLNVLLITVLLINVLLIITVSSDRVYHY